MSPVASRESLNRNRHRYMILVTIAFLAFSLVVFIFITSDVSIVQRPRSLPLPSCAASQRLEPPVTRRRSRHDYDLANLLNIASFRSLREHEQLNNSLILQHAAARKGSILSFYAAEPSKCVAQPSITRLRKAVQKYFTRNEQFEEGTMRDQTLVIHHEPEQLDLAFIQSAVDLAKKFSRIRLLIPDSRFQRRLIGIQVIVHHYDTTDRTISRMFAAPHLLVHTGTTSALGALITKGTVYHTGALSEYTSQNSFRWLVRNRVPLSSEKVSPYANSLDYLGPVVPTCCDLQPFGEGDEEKIVCANVVEFQPPCWILAVGSNGMFGFEEDVVKKTKCHIHTFDCTGEWEVPTDLADRVTLHKICLGDSNDGLFRTWEEVIKIGSKNTSPQNLTMPSFVKMDIEGYEFPVIKSLVESDEALPVQIAMEVHKHTHMRVGPPFMNITENSPQFVSVPPRRPRFYVSDFAISEMFVNLSRKGYDLVYRADNPFCPYCSEVLVVRRSALPAD